MFQRFLISLHKRRMVPACSRYPYRTLISALAMSVVFFTGCFTSDAPLISTYRAEFPIPNNVILRPFDLSGPGKGKEKIKGSYEVTLKDGFYVFKTGGKVKFRLRLARVGKSPQYIAMVKMPEQRKYVYGLVEKRNERFHFFMFTYRNFDKYKRNHLVTAFVKTRKGEVAVDSLSSLVDLFPSMLAAGAFSDESAYRVVSPDNVTSSAPAKSGDGESPSRGAWQLINTTNPLTDAATPIARLEAQRVDGGPKSVWLQLECQGREAVLYLDWAGVPLRPLFRPGGVAITDIDVRFDKARPNRLVWSIVSDGQVRNPPPGAGALIQLGLNIDATLIPSRRGLNATWAYDDFTRPLSSSRRLIVQAHSSRNQRITAFFDTVGAATAVNHVRRVCP